MAETNTQTNTTTQTTDPAQTTQTAQETAPAPTEWILAQCRNGYIFFFPGSADERYERREVNEFWNGYHEFRKGFCPVYASEALSRAYEAYHALGGNGTITGLYNQIIAVVRRAKSNSDMKNPEIAR